MLGPKFGGAFSVTGNKLVYAAGANVAGISSDVYVGTIDAINPALIVWTTTAAPYPGLNKEQLSTYVGNLTELMVDPEKVKNENPLEAVYPPGAMYRFDAAPWGTDRIIVSNGSPTSAWTPANPCPTYAYDPVTDIWEQQPDLPIAVLGASLGTVNSGSTWKLVVATGYTGSVSSTATQIYTADLGGAATFQLTVSVENGWNMVSVPGVNPDGQGVNTWWSGRNTLADVYKWNGTYTAVTSATPTEGYWMLHTGANTYNTGDEWPAGGIQIVAHDPIAITTGWNMIGGYENSALVSGLTTTPAGLIVAGTVYGWNGAYYNPTNLVPGYGYWLLSTGAGVINPPTLANGSSKLVAQDNKEEWGKITLTDAAGKSYVLYAVNGEVNLESYQLPPLPPTGTFDVRYSSGKKAEKFDKEIQTIEMRGITYPVKVRVEKVGIRITG